MFSNPLGRSFRIHWEGLARSGLFCWGVLAWPVARWAAAAPPPDLKAAWASGKPGRFVPRTGLDQRQAQPRPAARGTGPPSRGLLKISARRHLGRCPGLQSQMRQDALDYRRFEDGGDDLELATAVRAVLDVDLESEASAKTNLYSSYVVAKTHLSSRAQLMRAGRPCVQPGSVAVSSDLPVTSSGPCGTTSALSFALGASTPWSRIRCSRGRGTGA